MQYTFELKHGKKSIYIIFGDGKAIGTLSGKILRRFIDNDGVLAISEYNIDDFETEVLRYGRERLFRFLSYRDRSLKEARTFLKELPLSYEFSKQLIDFCLEKKFLNDKRFAEMFVISGRDSQLSRKELRYKLKEKGISPEYIDYALSEYYDASAESENLKEKADYAFRRYRTEDKRKHKQKCLEFLIRKGFSYHSAKQEIDKRFDFDEEYEFD